MDCGAKHRYHSKQEAEKVIRIRLKANPTLYLRAYRCNRCGLWHLTHQPDKREMDLTG